MDEQTTANEQIQSLRTLLDLEKVKNVQSRELMAAYIKENVDLKEKLAVHISKTVKTILEDVAETVDGEDELLDFVAKRIHGQVKVNIKKKDLIEPVPTLMESICEYNHEAYLSLHKSWFLRIIKKIGELAPANNVDQTCFERYRKTRFASLVANLNSVVSSTYSWSFGLGFQVIARIFSSSQYIGDCANEFVPGGVNYGTLTDKLQLEAKQFADKVRDRIKLKHANDFLMVVCDNNVKKYEGDKEARMAGTSRSRIVPVLCNVAAIAVKMEESEENTQLNTSLVPGTNAWASPSDVDHRLVLELTADEQKRFEFVVDENINKAKDFVAKHTKAIESAVATKLKDLEGKDGKSMAQVVEEQELARAKENGTIADKKIKEHIARCNPNGTGRIEALDSEENDLITFEEWWKEKRCKGCERIFSLDDTKCSHCIDHAGSPVQTDPDYEYNPNYNKAMKLPNKKEYLKEFVASRGWTKTRFPTRITRDRAEQSGITKRTEYVQVGPHKFKNVTRTKDDPAKNIGDKETNDRMTVISCKSEMFNPGESMPNKIRVVEICKHLGDVKTEDSNPNGERGYIVEVTDIGAQAPAKHIKNGVVQICGAWHEYKCYQITVCEIVYPMIGKFYSLFLTNGDNDGLRQIFRKGLNHHKCIQYLKESAQVIVATYWSEFKLEVTWAKHDETTFKEFLENKRNQDEQHKMYIDTFILKLLPSLFAFEYSLRTNDADMRKAARKSLLPYLPTRHRFNYVRQVIREHIMIEHCAPEAIRIQINKYAYSYNKDGIDSYIEKSNKQKKRCLGGANSELAWGIADLSSSYIEQMQEMLLSESGVPGTKFEPESRKLPMKDDDIINCLAMLAADSPMRRARDAIESDPEHLAGILGEKIFPIINTLESVGRDRITQVLKKINQGESLEDVTINSSLVLIWEFEAGAPKEEDVELVKAELVNKEVVDVKNSNEDKKKKKDDDDDEDKKKKKQKITMEGATM